MKMTVDERMPPATEQTSVRQLLERKWLMVSCRIDQQSTSMIRGLANLAEDGSLATYDTTVAPHEDDGCLTVNTAVAVDRMLTVTRTALPS